MVRFIKTETLRNVGFLCVSRLYDNGYVGPIGGALR